METQTHENRPAMTDPARVTMSQVTIDRLRRCITATALAAGKEHIRPVLTHILCEFTPETWTFTATNSYFLISCEMPADRGEHPTDDRPAEGSALIPAAWATKTLKAWKKTTTGARLTITPADVVTLETYIPDRTTATAPVLPQEFPKWRNLWPTETATAHIAEVMADEWNPPHLNPSFLATICKAVETIGGKTTTPIKWTQPSPTKPNTYEAHHEGVTLRAILMPVRPS